MTNSFDTSFCNICSDSS